MPSLRSCRNMLTLRQADSYCLGSFVVLFIDLDLDLEAKRNRVQAEIFKQDVPPKKDGAFFTQEKAEPPRKMIARYDCLMPRPIRCAGLSHAYSGRHTITGKPDCRNSRHAVMGLEPDQDLHAARKHICGTSSSLRSNVLEQALSVAHLYAPRIRSTLGGRCLDSRLMPCLAVEQ